MLDVFDRVGSDRDRADRLQRDWRTWCPQAPWPRQQAFLDLDCEEALFGGAAGPGKSSALLMAALQYVNQPGYAALILRHEFKELEGPGGLLDRACEWLIPQGVDYNKTRAEFRFPSGAVLKFGGCSRVEDVYRFWGWEVQFLGIDEVTEFEEQTYLTSHRLLRRREGSQIPIRVRAATNPGGRGHLWVKKRFITAEATQALREKRPGIFWSDKDDPEKCRAYVPALISDNPAVDAAAYRRRLVNLDPVTRERLLNGDWSVREDSRIDPAWLRYYLKNAEYYSLRRADGEQFKVIHPRECERFITIDTAGTSKEKAREAKGKAHSWTVISTWDFHRPSGFLIYHRLRRGRWEAPEVIQQIRRAVEEDQPHWTGIEQAHIGPAVMQILQKEGVQTLRAVSHDCEDKLTRATDFLNLCHEGRIYLPKEAPWLEEIESEWFAWTGDPDEQADIIDTAAYAGRYVVGKGRGVTVLPSIGIGGRTNGVSRAYGAQSE